MNPVRPEEPLSLSKGRLEGPAQVVRDASSSSSAAPHHERMWVPARSEEHTSELQSLMRISYAVFCLKKKKNTKPEKEKYKQTIKQKNTHIDIHHTIQEDPDHSPHTCQNQQQHHTKI